MQAGQLSYGEILKAKKKLRNAAVVEHLTFLVHPDNWHVVVSDYGADEKADRHDYSNITFIKHDRIRHA